MTAFVVNPKYNQGCMVQYLTKEEPTKIQVGKIIAITTYQSVNFRPGVCSISYFVEPEEFIGFEHDDEISISEVNGLPDSLPCILGLI